MPVRKKLIVDRKELEQAFSNTDPDLRFYLDTVDGKLRRLSLKHSKLHDEEVYSAREIERAGHYVVLPKLSWEENQNLIEDFATLQSEKAIRDAIFATLKESNPGIALKNVFFDYPELAKKWSEFKVAMLCKKISSQLDKEGLELQLI